MRLLPPDILYPKAIDSDTTLYAVYNTSESTLATNNQAWSEEITIIPVDVNKNEIWALNGFLNISGELIYYDLVEKNSDGKIFKFKRCLRNFGRIQTQFNAIGTPVRGFVVAEHHKQLVDAIISVEDFVGENFSTDIATLDWRIRNLQNTPTIIDDFGCPTITLITEIVSQDNVRGTTINYEIDIVGTVDKFLLDFGDGFSTTSTQSGTHIYAPNANIDPVISATTGNCSISQTAIKRSSDTSPTAAATNNLVNVVIPNIPNPPNININVAPTDFKLPIIPINFPCLNLGISSFNFPSVIDVNPGIPSFIDTNIPSIIDVIGGFTLPSSIIVTGGFSLPSIIDFTNSPTIPSIISFGNVPSIPEVQFATPFFPLVQFGPTDFPNIQVTPPNIPPISFGPAPVISVAWGTPPVISCACSITCPSASGASMAAWQTNYLDDLGIDEVQAPVEYNFAGIPSEIRIVPANIPPAIKLEHDLPSIINIITPKFDDIRINASEIPREIKIIAPNEIRITGHEIPKIIKIEMPEIIKFEDPKIPSVITIDGSGIPSIITINGSGIPSYIELKHNLPDFIQLRMPDNPVIELAPIEVTVKLDMQKIMTDNESDAQCVMLVPCRTN